MAHNSFDPADDVIDMRGLVDEFDAQRFEFDGRTYWVRSY